MTKSKEAQEQATAVQGPIILPEFADEYRKAQRALTKAVKDHLRMATEHQAVHKAQEAVRAEQVLAECRELVAENEVPKETST